MKRFLLILGVLLLFTSCSEAPQNVITYKDQAMDADTFKLLLSVGKAQAADGESDDFWQTEEGHMTADLIKSDAANTAMQLLYLADAAANHGISPDEQQIEDYKAQMYEPFGSKEALEAALKRAKISVDTFESYAKLCCTADLAKNFILTTPGLAEISDPDYLRYFQVKFATLRHLYLNNKTYPGGRALPDEQVQKVNQRADEIEKQLAEGATLEQFASDSDDGVLQSFPDGVTIPLGDELYQLADYENSESLNLYGLYCYLLYQSPEFTRAALGSEESQVVRCQTQDGIFFVQRLPLDQSAYEQYLPMIKESEGLKDEKISSLVSDERQKGEFVQNQALIESMLIGQIPALK